MTDNLDKTGKGDDIRINMDQNHEVDYWTKEFEISEERLRKAVEAVGPMVKDVKRYLQK